MYSSLKRIAASIIASLAVILLYTILHEGGHALAAVLSGGRITAFDVNFLTSNPHISYSGVTSTGAQAFIAIAGPVFPYLVWLASLGYMRRVREHLFLRLLFLVVSIQVLGTLLTNAVLPLLYMRGAALGGEDVVKFLTLAGIQPVIVTMAFMTLLLFSGWLAFRLLRPTELVCYLKQLRQAHSTPRERAIIIAVGILMVIGAVSVMMRVTSGNRFAFFPKNYDTRVKVSFSGLSDEWSTIQEFSVSETKEYDFVYSLRVKAPTTLRLVTDNPEGIIYTDTNHIVLCENATSLAQAKFTGYALLPGDYRLEVKTADKTGSLDMYISSRDLDTEHASYLTLLRKLRNGMFSADDYQEVGYELVYQGDLGDTSDKLVYSLDNAQGRVSLTVLVVGEHDAISVQYKDGQTVHPVLTNTRATIGFGITTRSQAGQLMLSSAQAEGKIYIYIKR